MLWYLHETHFFMHWELIQNALHWGEVCNQHNSDLITPSHY